MIRIPIHTVSNFTASGGRPIQEDYSLALPESGIFAVADGFGGAPSGPEASRVACEAVRNYLEKEAGDLEATMPFVLRSYFSLAGNVLFNAILYANSRLLALNRSRSVNERGGASLLAGYLDGDLLAIANVGVCTAWLIRDGESRELVRPRSYGTLIDPFESDAEEATCQAPLMALGMVPDLEPEIYECRVRPGDYLLIQTDGMPGSVRSELESIQQNQFKPHELPARVAKAFDRAGTEAIGDNLAGSLIIF